MSDLDRSPGWDKRAVNRIAKEQYDDLEGMFAAHGWSTDGRVISQIAPTKVVSTYGSVDAFELAHRDGLDQNFVLHPRAVLEQEQPKVLLTSYFGFTPWDWPCLTFNDEGRRDTVLKETRPGFLSVIYGSNSPQTPKRERGKVLGVYQCSHLAGPTDSFLSPIGLSNKKKDERDGYSWAYAIQAVRAWRVPLDAAPHIGDFAPTTFSPERGRSIGRFGAWLTADEARQILDLDLVPEPIFGGREQVESVLSPAQVALRPSRPGPVSQSSYMVGEAEGPKHLYVLRLKGPADDFLGRPVDGMVIIKVGFSKSPETRCLAHNRALPACAFSWQVFRSTLDEGRAPFASSDAAKEGEQTMIKCLASSSESLGGEFFLTTETAISDAWGAGIRAAEARGMR